MSADESRLTNDQDYFLTKRAMLPCDSFLLWLDKMKILIAAVALVSPVIAHADYIPLNKQQPINFECQTGVKIHVVDKHHIVINGDFDAQVEELSEDRLQAQGYHGKSHLATNIDLRFMGGGFYSLLVTELDQTSSNEPWDDKVLGVTALICTRIE
ncbi:hypothetical protein TE10_16515 [Raoultella ornithinolytica]|uniref:hypothetical protein n=1 Tax=Raoultella ornithinolytica TaxID=54291 RepID=UPI000597F08F|nr:hypothetical protein TE10_16515 [Raoultella ornithinolytica]